MVTKTRVKRKTFQAMSKCLDKAVSVMTVCVCVCSKKEKKKKERKRGIKAWSSNDHWIELIWLACYFYLVSCVQKEYTVLQYPANTYYTFWCQLLLCKPCFIHTLITASSLSLDDDSRPSKPFFGCTWFKLWQMILAVLKVSKKIVLAWLKQSARFGSLSFSP